MARRIARGLVDHAGEGWSSLTAAEAAVRGVVLRLDAREVAELGVCGAAVLAAGRDPTLTRARRFAADYFLTLPLTTRGSSAGSRNYWRLSSTISNAVPRAIRAFGVT
ncbi:hypothetical protein [Agromyces allii]|uniref:Uncharacterized protein n=1 Tax=Agromyces allii TaxID=393607 RepID=A0ABP5BQ84_9MICO|nr:hypothetical protein [Agromyces allii]